MRANVLVGTHFYKQDALQLRGNVFTCDNKLVYTSLQMRSSLEVIEFIFTYLNKFTYLNTLQAERLLFSQYSKCTECVAEKVLHQFTENAQQKISCHFSNNTCHLSCSLWRAVQLWDALTHMLARNLHSMHFPRKFPISQVHIKLTISYQNQY